MNIAIKAVTFAVIVSTFTMRSGKLWGADAVIRPKRSINTSSSVHTGIRMTCSWTNSRNDSCWQGKKMHLQVNMESKGFASPQ